MSRMPFLGVSSLDLGRFTKVIPAFFLGKSQRSGVLAFSLGEIVQAFVERRANPEIGEYHLKASAFRRAAHRADQIASRCRKGG